MALTIVTAPATEPVTLAEIKEHIRITSTAGTAEDSLLNSLITVARDCCERFQNRAFIQQTWDYVIDKWPAGDSIEIPLPPLISCSSVTYYATGGTSATMTSSTYIVDTDSEPGRIVLGYGEIWPTTTLRPANGVVIRFVSGYGSTASAVPARMKQAISVLIGHMYEHRETTDIKELIEVPYGAKNLLWFDRVAPL